MHEVGEAPDYRFTLANERTFLAWVRSALAMMAACVSYTHWQRNEPAMRLAEQLPRSPIPLLVAGVLTVTAAVALVLTVVDPGWG